MSAVDAPPGLSFAGLAINEFESRQRSRRLAWGVLLIVCLLSALTIRWVHRYASVDTASIMMSGPLFCIMLSCFGVAIRSAKIRFTSDKISWVMGPVEFGVAVKRIKSIKVYDDSVAITPLKGGTWFLSQSDWGEVSSMEASLDRTHVSFQRIAERAPFWSRVQSYGRALDMILILNVLVTVGLMVYALRFVRS